MVNSKRIITITSIVFISFLLSSNNLIAELEETISEEISLSANDDPVWIDSDADFATLGFNGSGTSVDPYRIENLKIRTGAIPVDIGIYVSGVTSYFIIQNCDISANYFGIQVTSVERNRTIIFNNSVHDIRGGIGISVDYAQESLIANNTVMNTDTGISVYSSSYSEIIFNTCSFSNTGMDVGYLYFSIIEYNTLEFNYNSGLYCYFVSNSTVANNRAYKNDDGMVLFIDYSIFENNTAEKNYYYGIFLYKSNYTLFRYNLVYRNERYGFRFYYPFNYINGNNTLYENLFIANDIGSWYSDDVQAIDSGINNTWYNPKTNRGNLIR